MEIPKTMSEFFTWIGSTAFLGIVLSIIAEAFPKWETLDAKLKRWIIFAISIGLGVASTALIKYVPAGVVEGMQDWYSAFAGGVAIFSLSQLSHYSIIERESRAEEAKSVPPKVEKSAMPSEGLSEKLAPAATTDGKADG